MRLSPRLSALAACVGGACGMEKSGGDAPGAQGCVVGASDASKSADDARGMQDYIADASGKLKSTADVCGMQEMAPAASGTGKIIADVGCDHGLLSCHLALQGHTVVAIDCSAASLQKCQRRADTLRLGNLYTLLGDGLTPLQTLCDDAAIPSSKAANSTPYTGIGNAAAAKIDAVVIAGIGAGGIADILADAPACCLESRYILCPSSRPEQLRLALRRMGYGLIDEHLVVEDRRFYPILIAQKGSPWLAPSLFDLLGPCLLHKREPKLVALAAHHLRHLQIARRSMPPAKLRQTQAQLELLQRVAQGNWPDMGARD